jgi:hypothetical protein
MGKTCSRHGKYNKHTTFNLLGKPERLTPLGRIKCKWEENIKKDLGFGLVCGERRALVNA